MSNQSAKFFNDKKNRKDEDEKIIKKYDDREFPYDDDYVNDKLTEELLKERGNSGTGNAVPSKKP